MTTVASSFAIGIDLGTTFTYCCVAVLRHQSHEAEIIPNEMGKNTTPSYVAYTFEDENDVYAGETAKDLAFDNPENTVFDIKRLIGRTFYDPHIQRYNHLWPFHLVNIHGLVGVKIGRQPLLPQIIATELISHLKKTAENYLNCSIDSAVVTIPVYYNDLQQGVTREACSTAGLTQIHFIREPVAAAVAYGLQSSPIESGKTKTCLIFDLGGGTFDVTIFTLDSEKQVKIQAVGGDDRLGGEDFNDLLTEYCINDFKTKHGIDLASGKNSEDVKVRKNVVRKLRRVRNECEKQKRFLSSTTAVVVSLDGLHPDIPMTVPITRKIFEDLIGPHLTRCMETLDGILRKNGFKKGDIDDVILIGGSSRIPKVQEMLGQYFEGKRLHRSIDADEAVACGAAIYACNSFHGRSSVAGVTLLNMLEAETSFSSNNNRINPQPQQQKKVTGAPDEPCVSSTGNSLITIVNKDLTPEGIHDQNSSNSISVTEYKTISNKIRNEDPLKELNEYVSHQSDEYMMKMTTAIAECKYWAEEDLRRLNIKLRDCSVNDLRLKYPNSSNLVEGQKELLQGIEKRFAQVQNIVKAKNHSFLVQCKQEVSNLSKLYIETMENINELKSISKVHTDTLQKCMDLLLDSDGFSRLTSEQRNKLQNELSTSVDQGFFQIIKKWSSRQSQELIQQYNLRMNEECGNGISLSQFDAVHVRVKAEVVKTFQQFLLQVQLSSKDVQDELTVFATRVLRDFEGHVEFYKTILQQLQC